MKKIFIFFIFCSLLVLSNIPVSAKIKYSSYKNYGEIVDNQLLIKFKDSSERKAQKKIRRCKK